MTSFCRTMLSTCSNYLPLLVSLPSLSSPLSLSLSLSLTEVLPCGGCGNGICDTATETCECPTGFVGDHCSCKSSSLPLCVCLSLFLSFSPFLSLPPHSPTYSWCVMSVFCVSWDLSVPLCQVFFVLSLIGPFFFLFVLCCAVSVFSVSKGVARLLCPVPVRFVLSLIGCPSLSVGGIPRFPVILAVYCPFRVTMYDVVCL